MASSVVRNDDMLAIVLLRNDAAVVNDAVWIRGSIVVGSALLMSAGWRVLRID